MALDFTVIIAVRQRFGDRKADDSRFRDEQDLESDAPFIGAEGQYAFRCPGVDPAQPAVLLFQQQGVTSTSHQLQINGRTVVGGVPKSVDTDTRTVNSTTRTVEHARWHGNVMLVEPGVLRESNALLIRAVTIGGDFVDDFIVDNVVILFKTRAGGVVGGNAGVSTGARRKGKPKKARKGKKKK